MSATCHVCDEPLTDNGTLCHGDARALALALRDVPWLYAQLELTVTKQARIQHRNGPRPAVVELDPVRMVFDLRASEARDHLEGMLRSWVINLADDTAVAYAGPLTLAGYAAWLGARAGVIRMREWGPDAYDEVMGALRFAHTAIDAPPDLEPVGACPTEDCGAELWCKRNAPTVRCRECQATHDRQALRDALLEQASRIRATAPVIARALTASGEPLKLGRIHVWVHRGLLEPVGKDAKGGSLFRLGDVRAVLERMERRVPKGVIGQKGKR